MTQATRINLQRQWIKTVKERAKQVLAENGIKPSTRKGNKALNYAMTHISVKPINTPDEALALGESIGQAIVDLSKEHGKDHLDEKVVLNALTDDKLPAALEKSPATMKPDGTTKTPKTSDHVTTAAAPNTAIADADEE